MTPAPRTSETIGCAAAMRLQAALEMRADGRDVRQQVALEQLIHEIQPGAAGQQVAAVGAAVIAGRHRLRRSTRAAARRQSGCRRQAPCRSRSDRDPGRGPSSRTRMPRAAEAALHFVGDDQRAGPLARRRGWRRQRPPTADARRPRPESARRRWPPSGRSPRHQAQPDRPGPQTSRPATSGSNGSR